MQTTGTGQLTRTLATLALALATTHPAWALRHLQEGDRLPPFSAEVADGSKLSAESFKGKPFVVAFVRPRQAESVRALEELGAVLTQRAGTPLAAIAVPTADDPDDVVGQYVREHKLPITVARDPDRKMYGECGIIVSPTLLFVDGAGILRFHVPHLPPGYARQLGAHADLLLGTIDEAEHAVRIANAPDETPAGERSFATRLTFARLLVRHGKDAQARQILDGLDPVGGTSPEAAALLATLLLRQGDTERAAALLAPYRDHEPASADLHVALARLAVVQGNMAEAATHLEAARGDGPSRDRSEILYALGALYEKANQLGPAAACYREALAGLLGGAE